MPGPTITTVRRVVVATDRSTTADDAVHRAARMAAPWDAELILAQVLPVATEAAAVDDRLEPAHVALRAFARELAGARGRARVVVDDDPAAAILGVVEQERADVVVVGNLGMHGRRHFLLGNIPNRISHNARCTVIIVNTGAGDGASGAAVARTFSGTATDAVVDSHLLTRAWQIGRVLTRAGLRELLERPAADDPATERLRAQRLRVALEELGPTFAKIGQILSTRPDLLPPAYIEELATLQEHVTPLTEAEAVAAMERELGVPWEDVFASIEPTPLATWHDRPGAPCHARDRRAGGGESPAADRRARHPAGPGTAAAAGREAWRSAAPAARVRYPDDRRRPGALAAAGARLPQRGEQPAPHAGDPRRSHGWTYLTSTKRIPPRACW